MRAALLLFSCLALLCMDATGFAATRARVCRQSCGAAIQGCIADGGRPRACRRQTIRRCKRLGTTTCLIVPTTTTTAPRATTPPTTTTVTTTSSTTTTRPAQGLAGLLGTWDFTYSIISTFEDRYVMSAVQTSDDGIPFILAYDVYAGVSDALVARPADLGFTSFPYEFALLDAGVLVCDFFVFNKTGANTVSGLYFLSDVDFDGSCGSLLNPTDPYPMSGVRTSASAVSATVVTDPSAVPNVDAVVQMLAVMAPGR